MKWIITTKYGQYVVADKATTLPTIGNIAIVSDDRERALQFPTEDCANLFITGRGWPMESLRVEPVS